MQLSRGTRALRCKSGQALVEFALVFPIFMLMLFGLIDVGRLVYTNSAVSQAAREGARLAAAEVAWVGLPATTPGCVVDPSGIDASDPGAHVCPPSTAALEANVLEAVNRMTVGMDQVTTVYLSCNGGDAKRIRHPPATGPTRRAAMAASWRTDRRPDRKGTWSPYASRTSIGP